MTELEKLIKGLTILKKYESEPFIYTEHGRIVLCLEREYLSKRDVNILKEELGWGISDDEAEFNLF